MAVVEGWLLREVPLYRHVLTLGSHVQCECVSYYLQGATALGLISINWRLLRRAAEQRISHVGRLASEAGLTSPSNSTSEQVSRCH